ncbi:MAG: hypothetical protein ACLGI7_05865, partial [Gammaproteobacteria bacterium]
MQTVAQAEALDVSRLPAPASRVNLFGLDRAQLRAAFEAMGEKPYRA